MEVEQITIKLPNPMTMGELMAKGMSPEAAQHKMNEFVFGVGYSKDENGKPVEQGLGSKLQPTAQHLEALRVANERKVAQGGVNPDLIAAIAAAIGNQKGAQVITPEILSAAVAAGIRAGLSAHKEAEEL